jgi:hypothetical protein
MLKSPASRFALTSLLTRSRDRGDGPAAVDRHLLLPLKHLLFTCSASSDTD